VGPQRTRLVAHHLTSGRALSYALLGIFVVTLVSMVRSHELTSQWGAVALMAGATAVVYVLGLRPAVVEAPTGVEVRNPLRTTTVPWQELARVDVVDVLRLHTEAGPVRCFAVPRRRPSVGQRSPSAASYNFGLPSVDPGGAWQPPKGQGRAEALADRLGSLREEYRASGVGPVVTRWATDAIVALVAAALLVTAALIIR
jgi:hypothetical protein